MGSQEDPFLPEKWLKQKTTMHIGYSAVHYFYHLTGVTQ